MSSVNDSREALRLAVAYNAGDPKRVQHLIKVYAFAEMIADGEQLPDMQRRVLLTAAALHDIGIYNAERRYGSSSGKYQELEGPPVVRALLADWPQDFVDQVCDLVARHHTYTNIDRLTLRILIEADFLVNAYEDGLSAEAVHAGGQRLFATATGQQLLRTLYATE